MNTESPSLSDLLNSQTRRPGYAHRSHTFKIMNRLRDSFCLGETVQLADACRLDDLQRKYSDRLIVVPEMARFASQRVRIKKACSVDGYEFFEIEGRWMEEALLDPCLLPDIQKTDPLSYSPANETYRAIYDNDTYFGNVSIIDTTGTVYWTARSGFPKCDSEFVNWTATIRARICFEQMFKFIGKYPGDEEAVRTMR